MFGAAAVYGAITKRSLAAIGGYCFMGLIGLHRSRSLVNLFLQSSSISWIISIMGVVIFMVLTAWDVQRISNGDLAAATGSVEKARGHRRAPRCTSTSSTSSCSCCG